MQNKGLYRKRRHMRVRRKIFGTAEKPRLVVFRSSRHIYGQLIDDTQGKTVLGISSSSPIVAENVKEEEKGKIGISKVAGKCLAEKAVQAGVKRVVFDRAGYKYHGRVKAFAEGARDGGLEF